MATEVSKDGNKYEWQSWPPDSLEGMPPKRRRLLVWGLWCFFLLGALLGAAMDAVNVPQPWNLLLTIAVLAAIFGPLIRGAVLETRALRAEGTGLPSYPITRKTVASMAVITGVLWIALAIFWAVGRPTFPLLPLAGTLWLAYQLFRRRLR